MSGTVPDIEASPVIVGVDEAGRGALAGPVVAGACVLIPTLNRNRRIRDSKQMTPDERDEAFTWITEHCMFGFGIVGHDVIDREGILAANERAMQEAVAMVATKIRPTYLLVDGRDKFWFDYPHSSIIDGDVHEPCIAAASIVAKVTRDRLMVEQAKLFPQYGFEQHKAYGTPEHQVALRTHGPCPIHRQTFLKTFLTASLVPTQAESLPQAVSAQTTAALA